MMTMMKPGKPEDYLDVALLVVAAYVGADISAEGSTRQ